jgi:hypothetical protein
VHSCFFSHNHFPAPLENFIFEKGHEALRDLSERIPFFFETVNHPGQTATLGGWQVA